MQDGGGLMSMISTTDPVERQNALLSETAKSSAAGPLRFLAALLVGGSLIAAALFMLNDRLTPLAAWLSKASGMAAASDIATRHPQQAPDRLLTAPTLSGPVMLLPMSPTELMQHYPPQPGQSLQEGEFDLPAWQRFARPYPAAAQPRLAMLLTGLGLNKALTAAAILYLPPDVSLSFSPYAPELGAWIETARAHGHEAFVDLPLESAAPQDDTGPDALMTGLRPEENEARLDRIIGRAPHALGVATSLGSRFLTDRGALQPVFAAIKKRGLAVIESSADPRLLTGEAGAAIHLPRLKAADSVDQAAARIDILRALEAMGAQAREARPALLVVQPSPLSVALIAAWCQQLPNQGLALAPASNMLAQ